MEIKKTASGALVTLQLAGRLDTTTAPELEAEIKASLEGTRELIIDMNALEYISSAGLRVLLSAQKAITKQEGRMVVRGANESILDVFTVTGFCDILNIE